MLEAYKENNNGSVTHVAFIPEADERPAYLRIVTAQNGRLFGIEDTCNHDLVAFIANSGVNLGKRIPDSAEPNPDRPYTVIASGKDDSQAPAELEEHIKGLLDTLHFHNTEIQTDGEFIPLNRLKFMTSESYAEKITRDNRAARKAMSPPG